MAAAAQSGPAEKLQELLDEAAELIGSDSTKAESILRDLVLGSTESSPEVLRVREQAIFKLGELFAQTGQAKKLEDLLRECRPFFKLLPKARTAKTGERPHECCPSTDPVLVLPLQCTPCAIRTR